jgi:hypothetical protein
MTGSVTGPVKAILRIEGLCVLAASLAAYSKFGAGWGIFAACFLLPDASFFAYLFSVRAGAYGYNAAHSYVGPMLVFIAAAIMSSASLLPVALIWTAHIGFDRALGYGLKYEDGFAHTHLGLIGRAAREASRT